MRRFGGSFMRHQLKKRAATALRLMTDWALFILAVLVGGIGTSWYMVEAGSRLTTVSSGPWMMWTTAARSDADPYTRAHFARIGALPLPSDVAETYLARTDDDGGALHSSCDYVLELKPPAGAWWSLAVFDADGRLIQNAAERHAYTSETAAIAPDGRAVAALSRAASPGNWLPTGGAGRLSVVFTLIDFSPQTGTGDEARDLSARLPKIERRSCR